MSEVEFAVFEGRVGLKQKGLLDVLLNYFGLYASRFVDDVSPVIREIDSTASGGGTWLHDPDLFFS